MFDISLKYLLLVTGIKETLDDFADTEKFDGTSLIKPTFFINSKKKYVVASSLNLDAIVP